MRSAELRKRMAQTIFIIRHAEKPSGDGAAGVDATGALNPKSLTTRGWQRAGAWVELFAPSLAEPALPRPTDIFASAPVGHHTDDAVAEGSKSMRPVETVTPLATKLGIAVNQSFSRGRETDLGQALSGVQGVILVCWQHEAIFDIAAALSPTPAGLPGVWPGSCFNVMLKFFRNDPDSAWTFEQIVPSMLDGDSTSPLGVGALRYG
jgi:hypothetical protein